MKKIFIFLFLTSTLFSLTIIHKFPNAMVTDMLLNNNFFAFSSRDGSVKIFNIKNNKVFFNKSIESFAEVNTVAGKGNLFAYSGRLLGYSNTIKVYKNMNLFKNLDIGLVVSKMMFVGDNLVATTLNNEVVVYDKNFNKNEVVPNYKARGYSRYFYGIDKLNDNLVVFVNWGGDVYLYDIKNDEIIKHNNLGVKLQAVKKFGDYIVVSGGDDYIYILDKDLNKIDEIYIGFKSINLLVADDKLYVFPWGDDIVKIFDKDFNEVDKIKLDTICYSMASGRIQKYILFNCSDTVYYNILGSKEAKYFMYSLVYKPFKIALKNNKVLIEDRDGEKLSFDLGLYEIGKFYGRINGLSKDSGYGKIEVISDKHFRDTLIIYSLDGKKRAVIVKNPTNGYAHYVAGWVGDLVVSGGSNGEVYVYDRFGNNIAILKTKNNRIQDINYDHSTIIVTDERGKIYFFNRKTLDSTPYLELELFKA